MLHHRKYKLIKDCGLENALDYTLPATAIHCAAMANQVEAIQSIIKYPMNDPIIQFQSKRSHPEGTALHTFIWREEAQKIS